MVGPVHDSSVISAVAEAIWGTLYPDMPWRNIDTLCNGAAYRRRHLKAARAALDRLHALGRLPPAEAMGEPR